MKRINVISCVATLLLLANTCNAAIITWNTRGVATNVAGGILSFDELLTSTSYTYVDVAGAGFDLRVSSSHTMVLSTGDLNYVYPNSSLLFEFFATGTTTKVDVAGFAVDWRDLDGNNTAGTFTIEDRLGYTTILNTSSSIFSLGASLVTVDLNTGNGINPDGIKSTASGDWNNLDLAFISDLSSIPLHSFSLDNTTDWIAPTSLRLNVDIIVIPEPATIIIWSLLGLVAVGYGVWRRKRAA
ncbi:MAG: hypothetical protein KKE86_08330 [Planctomycetes bacterium]|nr:hypothetical protein [Planctomycetota bacterium]MBU4399327.1 hypothetical protein [Planctomycetota bacterium]MCG2684887.1 hypothetical protein [Planctomycetales bacterium]